MPENILPFITPGEVEAEIRKIASESSFELIILEHAKTRMIERDITRRHIDRVLKNGELMEAPRWDTEKERGYKCKFRRVTAGMEVTVIAKLVKREQNNCLVVTVF